MAKTPSKEYDDDKRQDWRPHHSPAGVEVSYQRTLPTCHPDHEILHDGAGFAGNSHIHDTTLWASASRWTNGHRWNLCSPVIPQLMTIFHGRDWRSFDLHMPHGMSCYQSSGSWQGS